MGGFYLMKRRIQIIIILCLFLISSIFTNITSRPLKETDISNEEDCYGFIIPTVNFGKDPIQYDTNTRIYNLINDFLRENISVYWTAENLTTSIFKINGSEEEAMFFEKGTFIVPFTENNSINTKICTIVCDYNQTSEIEEKKRSIPIFQMLESLLINAFKLSSVKIIQVDNKLTSSNIEFNYLVLAAENGFLSFDMIDEKLFSEKLNNNDYNLLIWPAATSDYFKALINVLADSLKKNSANNAIRDFVSNGGGFAGSCYAGFMAGSGILPVPLYFKRRANNPELNGLGLLALSDIITQFTFIETVSKNNILNKTHPVTYGIDGIVTSMFSRGPKIVHIGENTQVITEFKECHPSLEGTPSWTSSDFGEGRVVLFSDHPEMFSFDENENLLYNKIISNTFYYTTYEESLNLEILNSQNISFIKEIFNDTTSLFENILVQEEIFKDAKSSINSTIEYINYIIDQYYYRFYDDKYYIKQIRNNLESVEKLYELNKNDADFLQRLDIFNNTLENFLNTINKKFENLSEAYDKYLLRKYRLMLRNQPFEPFLRIKLLIDNHLDEKMMEKMNEPIYIIIKNYAYSLEFLRDNWYEYEVSIAC